MVNGIPPIPNAVIYAVELLSLLQIGRVVPARPGERARHAEDGGGGQDRGRLRGPHAAREGPHAEAQRRADRGTVQASQFVASIVKILPNESLSWGASMFVG